jgi:hypothetical protein
MTTLWSISFDLLFEIILDSLRSIGKLVDLKFISGISHFLGL